MIYVVSGFMRSGTSMMMNALINGGLEAAFAPERNEMNNQYGDEWYQPNSGGFFELTREEYKHEDFPLMYDGKLIKCLMGGLSRFPVHEYKVIFMKRDPEEIRQSIDAFFNPPEEQREKMRDFLENHYEKRAERHIDQLMNRRDTEVVVFNYRDVVEEPLEHFRTLTVCDWPIMMHRAAATVNPSSCRFKKEELTIGV
jgi:hypothetical protein